MKHPSQWTRTDLHQHLQHAIDLEFWTIPLYLTALYSVKGLEGKPKKEHPIGAKLVESVVVQEMLHLEIACNLSNALGHAPKFHKPVYDPAKGVPFIHPQSSIIPAFLKEYSVALRPLNREALKLFCVIELPEIKNEAPWESRPACHAIGELYDALAVGVDALWDQHFVGEAKNIKQKNNFREYHERSGRHHGFSQMIYSKESAMRAIEAIIAQGEGANAQHVPVDYQPEDWKSEDADAVLFKSNLSHYQKFALLLHHHHQLPEIYSCTQHPDHPLQGVLHSAYANFLQQMEFGFSEDGNNMPDTFWGSMFALADKMTDLWKSGICPSF